MKGILNFLNPFETNKNVVEEYASSSQASTQTVLSSTSSQISTMGTLGINPEIQKHFLILMDEANLPGPDYYEFRNVIKNGIHNLPENILYQTIFSTFKSLGISKTQLLQSIEQYIIILNKDKDEFDKTSKQLEQTNCVDKQNQLKTNQEKIIQLQYQINELNQINIQLQNEINNNSITLNKNINEFNFNFESMIKELNDDKVKINQYINE